MSPQAVASMTAAREACPGRRACDGFPAPGFSPGHLRRLPRRLLYMQLVRPRQSLLQRPLLRRGATAEPAGRRAAVPADAGRPTAAPASPESVPTAPSVVEKRDASGYPRRWGLGEAHGMRNQDAFLLRVRGRDRAHPPASPTSCVCGLRICLSAVRSSGLPASPSSAGWWS